MSVIERLAHLFARYDAEQEAFIEYVQREGRDATERWPHVDEDGHPE